MASGVRPPVVAVVDDQTAPRRVAERVLEVAFGNVVVVTGDDGRDAVRLRGADPPPDLMLVNGMMPEMDGPAAIAKIRALEARAGLPRVPIVIDSASPGMREAGLAAGADAALARPWRPSGLVAVAAGLLGRGDAVVRLVTRERERARLWAGADSAALNCHFFLVDWGSEDAAYAAARRRFDALAARRGATPRPSGVQGPRAGGSRPEMAAEGVHLSASSLRFHGPDLGDSWAVVDLTPGWRLWPSERSPLAAVPGRALPDGRRLRLLRDAEDWAEAPA